MKFTINIILLLFFFTALNAEISILNIKGVSSTEACKGEITLLATGNAGPFHIEILETGLVLSPVSGEILITNLCDGLITLNIHPIDFPHCITQLSAVIPINPALISEDETLNFSISEDKTGTQNQGNLPENRIVNISPNPSRGRIIAHFSWGLTPSTKIEIFNTNGQSVYIKKIEFSSRKEAYDFGYLPAGQYFFIVSPPKGTPIKETFIIN